MNTHSFDLRARRSPAGFLPSSCGATLRSNPVAQGEDVLHEGLRLIARQTDEMFGAGEMFGAANEADGDPPQAR